MPDPPSSHSDANLAAHQHRQRWLATAVTLSQDRNAHVACPSCDEGILSVSEIVHRGQVVELALRCPTCGSGEFVRGRFGASQGTSEG
ncbi:hypothetical protein FRC98_13010 [Lujinxingia vulgaris]|uniref:Uncharacterized protein n=1 Tax=Lujinxingia vulgaris TaxID=2600176 RepID=A0A5C6X6C5_9DELT|nr:hypothetical protein [Lujinxingia vulgaris]TXD36740.1 hypothetical protein FRC98_13010 [Lujinxingia vulgaris]